jgi:hypothetical protein
MIPDIRLMIVALLASIVAIGCCLGLFAAFRVNNEQFVRAPNGSPLLQLAFVTPDSVTDATAASFAVRLRMNTPAAVPAAANSDTGQETPQATGNDGLGDVAAASPADQSPAPNPTEQNATASPSTPSADAPQTAKAAKKMTRTRAVKLHRRGQPQTATAAQPGDQLGAFSQPAFQAGAPGIAPQTVRRRMVKRRRLNNTTAATTTVPRQTVVGSAPAGTAAR